MDQTDDPRIVWVYLGITVLAYSLSWLPLLLFFRSVKRAGTNMRVAAKTFALSFGLFLVPGIVLVLGLWMFLSVVTGEVSIAVTEPGNAIMTLLAVSLAYRRTRRKMHWSTT